MYTIVRFYGGCDVVFALSRRAWVPLTPPSGLATPIFWRNHTYLRPSLTARTLSLYRYLLSIV